MYAIMYATDVFVLRSQWSSTGGVAAVRGGMRIGSGGFMIPGWLGFHSLGTIRERYMHFGCLLIEYFLLWS